MNVSQDEPVVVTHIISGDLWAGAEVQVYNLCKGLLKTQAVRPTAVVFNEGLLSARLRELGIPVDVADETRLGPLGIILAIKTHCQRNHSHVVHTHGFKENILGILAKDLARVPRSIRTVHGNPETTFPALKIHKRLVHKLDLLLGRFRQDCVVAVSTQLEQRLETLFPGKVVKIFNFVDVDALREKWPRPTETKGGPLSIGIIGRLVPVKRIDLFLETLALLKEKNFAFRGTVIGTGPLENALKDIASKLDLSEIVEFKGFVDPVYDELCKLDILMMPSDHEGLPMTLLEASVLNTYVVAHNVGGIPDLLGETDLGVLVDQHDAHGYADAIFTASTSLKHSSTEAFRDYESLKEQFDVEQSVVRYQRLYRRPT